MPNNFVANLKEVYVCVTPNCPHPLHKMTVEEYKKRAIAMAKDEK